MMGFLGVDCYLSPFKFQTFVGVALAYFSYFWKITTLDLYFRKKCCHQKPYTLNDESVHHEPHICVLLVTPHRIKYSVWTKLVMFILVSNYFFNIHLVQEYMCLYIL